MTDWQPISGAVPPLSDAAWAEEFARYQESPEFQKKNSHMDVDDFKGIFWLEYLHRLLGRLIGIMFFVPFVWFVYRGYIVKRDTPKYMLMFVLGGMQGLLGWYMVKSGLVDNPQVSQYRLTAHLVSAFLIYAYMFWVALSLLAEKHGEKHPWFRKSVALTALICITIISGGFVAGLKAGKIFNTFPMMGEHWIPPGLFAMSPTWLNFFENMVTVQFDHRWLAIATFVAIIVWTFNSAKAALPPLAARASKALLHTAILQVALGIATLMLAVPIALGALHQAIAMLLFTVAILLVHSLKYGR